jgi:pantoate--beta-alanine ligase
MEVIAIVAQMQAERRQMTGALGLVPTMGSLHEGHLSLVRRARADNDHVVVSIFVNPTQFNESADFERYPRDPDRDLQLLEAEGVDAVFMPTVDEMYPPGFDDWIEVTGALTERLEGAARPGHFRGVTTVVARLFRIIQPDRAYFGQKDAQQLRIIRRMVTDLALAVEIVAMPIVRDPDGLAISSRNVQLSSEERTAGLALPQALAAARKMVQQQGISDAHLVRQKIEEILNATRVETPRRGVSTVDVHLEYVSVSDEETFEELDLIDRPALVLVAARVGPTRLIDNTIVVPVGVAVPEYLRALIA